MKLPPHLTFKPTQKPLGASLIVKSEAKTETPATTTTTTTPALDSSGGLGKTRLTTHLDDLWAKGDFAQVVNLIADEIAPLKKADFKGVDGKALIGLCSQVYVFEERVKAVLNKLSLVDQPAAKTKGLTLARDLADVSTRIFRRAVELQDKADPMPVGAWMVAKDTHKKAKKWSPEEHLAYVAQKTVEFYLKGGQESQIRDVNPEFLKGLKSGQLCEYVVDAYDAARASIVEPGKPSPGHTVLAKGNDAFSAGTFEVQKDAKGEITQVLIGTFSGHYRTGLEAQLHLVRHVVAALSVMYPAKSQAELMSLVVQREGQATNPRTIEVIGRGIGLEGAEAQRLENELKAEAMRWAPMDFTVMPGVPSGLPAEALALKDVVVGAIKDGLFLHDKVSNPKAPANAPKSVLEVLARVDDLMERVVGAVNQRASGGGEILVAHQLIGTLAALAEYANALPAGKVDDVAKKEIENLSARWNFGVAGTTGTDLGMIFSQKPVADRTTRLVATINPKATDEQLKDMIKGGMDVARFNTAHGTSDEKIVVMKKLRKFAAEMGKEIAIQVDLEGPKIRLGKFENPQKLEKNDIFLKAGENVTLTSKNVAGNPKLFPIDYPTMTKDAKVGDPVSMNDGTVALTIVSIDDTAGTMECAVLKGGKVWDNKGVAFPQSKLSTQTVTEEDLQNLTALLPHVDVVAQSFVQSADDIVFLRERMRDLGKVVPIIAKIERGNIALDEQALIAISLASEALMVARGDLGVEIGEAQLPIAERLIKDVGEKTGRPVMLATEVMMSVLQESRASRGDVEALFGAVVERQFEAVMLGKETSAHKTPGDVVREASGYLVFNEAQRELPVKKKEAPVLGKTTAAALFVSRSGTAPVPMVPLPSKDT
ncbi:MAG: pyruvate kinase [Deltaproteobacteria bacterium]|nr:pyruvate kinase [Deltaproteobacteria bacterium]